MISDNPALDAVYFDNAATSWPKPPSVLEAMAHSLEHVGGSPGRAGHRMSIAASRMVNDTRDALAELLGIPDPCRIAFTKNSTEALNIAIMGILRAGDHAICTSMEHNSVMRPLRHLEQEGTISLTVVTASGETGVVSAADVQAAIRADTRLVTAVHASNVTGTVQPVGEIGAACRVAGIPFLVDASQSAGALPLDVEQLNIDLLAVTGHKSLLGPTGTGALYVREGIEPESLARGGTGSKSELEYQPDFMPDKFEAGTLNFVGLAGLGAGVRYLLDTGVETIHRHERTLVERFFRGASAIPGVRLFCASEALERVGVVSFVIDGMTTSKTGLLLDRRYGVMSRIGLHCAPIAHRTIGTFPDGTVRFGFGFFNTRAQVDHTLNAIDEMARAARNGTEGTHD